MERPVFDFPESWLEHPVGRSETIPNQALSIQQLFERSLTMQPEYVEDLYPEEDEDSPILELEDRLDAMDKLTYYQERVEAAKLAQKRQKQAEEEQKKAEMSKESPNPKE